MDDLISRQAVINAIENTDAKMSMEEWDEITDAVMGVPSAQPEPLTDKEKRIFLAAMARELGICKKVDQELPTREAYEDTLESVCREIIRKVKGALWT